MNRYVLSASLLLTFVSATHAQSTDTNAESRFLSRSRQLTYEGRRSGEGYFAQDGQALIFQSEREIANPFYQIYLLDLQSGDSHRVSPGRGKTTCSFFRPGSEQVLFASTHLDPEAETKQKAELTFRASGQQRRYAWDYDEAMDIFAARRDGSQLQRLTQSPGYDAEGSYSPDGSKIVFCSLRNAYPTNKLSASDLKRWSTDPSWFGEIFIMNADGSAQKQLTHTAGYDGGPFFSPDGQRIIWRRFDSSGVIADVFSMRLDGSDVQQLTTFGAMSWAPYYHPSGRYFIFTANKLGFDNFELYLADADGTREPVRVTSTPGFDGLPVFSPDGKRLCWTSNRTGDNKSQLFLAEWNHAEALAALAAAPPRSSARATALSSETIPLPQLESNIATNDLQKIVRFLAADDLQGRMTGSAGARRAADFSAGIFRAAGLQPGGENGTYFQDFQFTSGTHVLTNLNSLVWRDGRDRRSFGAEKDFRPLSFSASGTATGAVVFAGYGLSVPGAAAEGYDSYRGLEVSNKVVLVLRYVPEEVAASRRQELNRYAGLRYKAMIAREHGARAILFVTGARSPNAGALVEPTLDGSLSGSGIIALSVSSNVVATMFRHAGKNLDELQAGLDRENPHAESGLALTNASIEIAAAIEEVKKSDRNVLAWLPASAGFTNETVLIGAHYDHLGLGESGAMLNKGDENQVHPGADDNASGTALILELAATLAAHPARPTFQRNILFALWSGEEMGLIGSTHFANQPLVPLTNLTAYLNFDMVGRLRENRLILQGIGSATVWKRMIEKRNVAAGFNVVLQEDPYLPTDVTAFYPKGVPVLNFFTGSHEEYHRPTDRPETLNFEGLKRIGDLARGIVLDLITGSNRVDYVKVERSTPAPGSRENLRAYLGTIPDYASEVAGVKLSGVRGASPADKGGLLGADVIVELGGQKIANIYDYTYALDAVKIGQPVKIGILRAGKRIDLMVTPEARK